MTSPGVRASSGLPTRYIILGLCMLINIISYTTRMNINMTIVAMVKETVKNETQTDTCINEHTLPNSPTLGFTYLNTTTPELKVDTSQGFDWSESLQGSIIGANYYGYIITTALGGQLAELLGTKRLIVLAMGLSSLCTLLTPLVSYAHPYALVADRVVIGLAQGVITSSMYTLLPYWIPSTQLGLAFGLIEFSGNVGSVITMPICALLSEYGFAGGWPSVFYVFGALAALIILPWAYFVYNKPELHPRISPAERAYIASCVSISEEKAAKSSRQQGTVPWGKILSSRKVWGVALTRFCNNCGSLLLRSKAPAYLKTVLHMPIDYNGYVNASLYVSVAVACLFWGYVSDAVNRRRLLPKTASRRLFESLSLCGSALVLGVIPLAGCNVLLIVLLLNGAMFLQGLVVGGENVVCVDIAPDHSGTVYGFTNGIGSLPGFIAPLFAGIMLDAAGEGRVMHQWNVLFWIGSGTYVLGTIIFCTMVNAEPESWGLSEKTPKTTGERETKEETNDNSKNDNHINKC